MLRTSGAKCPGELKTAANACIKGTERTDSDCGRTIAVNSQTRCRIHPVWDLSFRTKQDIPYDGCFPYCPLPGLRRVLRARRMLRDAEVANGLLELRTDRDVPAAVDI